MFVVRRSKAEDSETLLKLARMVHFINLPADESIIQQKILQSRRSFMAAAGETYGGRKVDRIATRTSRRHRVAGYGDDSGELFMFTLIDRESGGVLGTSQVHARMGGPGNPNYFYRLEAEERFSSSLQIGMKHTVARLDADESGPAEIGGLILQPSYRGHKLKLGRFLSLVRFHFMGLHRARFADRVLAEMMAVITPKGENLFWDAVGRKFVGVSYSEADQFCQYNREFIPELLPHGPIYLALLPLKVQNVVAQVGRETAPARRMLEKLGFAYNGCIDPFDAGPHLEAATDDIPPVRDTVAATVAGVAPKAQLKRRGIVSHLDSDGEFVAVDDKFAVDAKGAVVLGRDAASVLGVEKGERVGVTPTDGEVFVVAAAKAKPKRKTAKRKRTRKKAA